MSTTISDPRQEALNYLENHRIPILMNLLSSKIAFSRPKNPNDFILQELKKIQEIKAQNGKYTIYDEIDINSLFLSFDITNSGFVTKEQYQQAIISLGIQQSLDTPIMQRIDKKTFISSM